MRILVKLIFSKIEDFSRPPLRLIFLMKIVNNLCLREQSLRMGNFFYTPFSNPNHHFWKVFYPVQFEPFFCVLLAWAPMLDIASAAKVICAADSKSDLNVCVDCIHNSEEIVAASQELQRFERMSTRRKQQGEFVNAIFFRRVMRHEKLLRPWCHC